VSVTGRPGDEHRLAKREGGLTRVEGRAEGEAPAPSTLASLARLIRSKNAGPFTLTFDIMFDDEATYLRVKRSGVLTRELVAGLYGLSPDDVLFFYCDLALAVKASIPRPVPQGDLADSDGHGGQQYAPLMDIEIP
jgi:hypothetical protein